MSRVRRGKSACLCAPLPFLGIAWYVLISIVDAGQRAREFWQDGHSGTEGIHCKLF